MSDLSRHSRHEHFRRNTNNIVAIGGGHGLGRCYYRRLVL